MSLCTEIDQFRLTIPRIRSIGKEGNVNEAKGREGKGELRSYIVMKRGQSLRRDERREHTSPVASQCSGYKYSISTVCMSYP